MLACPVLVSYHVTGSSSPRDQHENITMHLPEIRISFASSQAWPPAFICQGARAHLSWSKSNPDPPRGPSLETKNSQCTSPGHWDTMGPVSSWGSFQGKGGSEACEQSFPQQLSLLLSCVKPEEITSQSPSHRTIGKYKRGGKGTFQLQGQLSAGLEPYRRH